jgi:UDP-glucuronate decarboxylase
MLKLTYMMFSFFFLYLGSHLIDVLLAEGHQVIGVDNFLTGQRVNLSGVLSNPNFQLIEHDVVNPNIPFAGSVDQIYHLACPASPVAYQKEPIRTVKTNVVGTLNMLELALRLSARILLSSTSEVYGDPLVCRFQILLPFSSSFRLSSLPF